MKTKSFLLVIVFQLLIIHLFAQAPKSFNYQGVARDADGQVLSGQTIGIRVSILSQANPNDALYTETHQVKTNNLGLFALKIGQGEALLGNMTDIDWGSAAHYVSTEMDVNNNGHFVMMGTAPLLSVPYALYAEKSGSSMDGEAREIDFSGTFGQTIRHNGNDWEASSNIYNTSNNVGIGTTSPSEKLDVNGNIKIGATNQIIIGNNRGLAVDASRNIMQGNQTGFSLTSGSNNNFIGHQAGKANTSGSNNSFIGYQSGLENTTGSANSFFGYKAGGLNTTGSNNFYSGLQAGYGSTTGINNIAIGTKAGFNIGSANDNTFVGREAGLNTTNNRNTFIGKSAGDANTVGTENTYIGYNANGVDTLENATAIGANTVVSKDSSLVLGNAANVGIGTSAPSSKLDVQGSIRMVDGNQQAGYVPVSDANGVMVWTDPSSISASGDGDWTVSGSNLFSAVSGNVGIGTTSPQFTLDVDKDGDSQLEQMRVVNFNSGSSAGAGMVIATNGGGDSKIRMFAENGSNDRSYSLGIDNSAGTFAINNGSNLGTSGLNINSSNNVGIGTSAPASTLDVNGTVSMSSLAVHGQAVGSNVIQFRGTTDTDTWINFRSGGSAPYGRSGAMFSSFGTAHYFMHHNGGNLIIAHSNESSETPDIDNATALFSLKADGNLGLGITNPQQKLDVTGSIRMNDGNQQAGYIVVSDSNGTMVWTDPTTIISGGGGGAFSTTNNITSNAPGSYASDKFVFGSPSLYTVTDSDHYSRMYFDKTRAAFRVGYGSPGNWDSLSVGIYSAAFNEETVAVGYSSFASGQGSVAVGSISTAMGDNTYALGEASFAAGFNTEAGGASSTAMGAETEAYGTASFAGGAQTDAVGFASFAIGSETIAQGDYSMATGNSTTASGESSFASGNNTTASGINAIAMGEGSTAIGRASFSLGRNNIANANYSWAMGELSEAYGLGSMAIGYSSAANRDYSFSIGNSNSTQGDYSLVIGNNTTAFSAYETVIGRYNSAYAPNSNSGWDASDRLFVVGNGTSEANRSNALTIYKDGEVVIPTGTAPATGDVLMADDDNGTLRWVTPVSPNSNAMVRFYTTSLWSHDAGSSSTWTTVSTGETGSIEATAGDVIIANVSCRFRLVNGGDTDEPEFRVYAISTSGACGDIGGTRTGDVQDIDNHRGQYVLVNFQSHIPVTCEGSTYKFVLQVHTGDMDDDIEIDDINLSAVRY